MNKKSVCTAYKMNFFPQQILLSNFTNFQERVMTFIFPGQTIWANLIFDCRIFKIFLHAFKFFIQTKQFNKLWFPNQNKGSQAAGDA